MSEQPASSHFSFSIAEAEASVRELFDKGNLPLAEIVLRDAMNKFPSEARFPYLVGLLAKHLRIREVAQQHFLRSMSLDPRWGNPEKELANLQVEDVWPGAYDRSAKDGANGFLVIKAWGYGFWSDIFHVLGMLLLSEITNRTPIVYWGVNSKFANGENNAFDSFFEPVSSSTIDDLRSKELDFFPPKWNETNLKQENVNKWQGQYARMAGLYLLNRTKKVIVSDFYTGVFELAPWIPAMHPMAGKSVDEIYSYLIMKYLRPQHVILDEAASFIRNSLKNAPYIAVHMRGSDKVSEVAELKSLNGRCINEIDRRLERYEGCPIFLMTDDENIRQNFYGKYGNRVVATDCQRTADARGIHDHADADRYRLGVELMVDSYVAAKARFFLGNAYSNPSLMVRYLRDWRDPNSRLVGHNMLHRPNSFLYSC